MVSKYWARLWEIKNKTIRNVFVILTSFIKLRIKKAIVREVGMEDIMILNKRIKRNLKNNLGRNLALFFLIALGMYFVVSFVGSAETIMNGIDSYQKKNNVEDAEFSTFQALTSEEEKALEKKKITLQKMYYLDFRLGKDNTLRTFIVREQINKNQIDKGSLPIDDSQVVLEKHYAESNGYKIGDTIEIANIKFTVCGLGSTADYEKVLEEDTDINVNSKRFGTAFFNQKGYEKIKDTGKQNEAERYLYAIKTSSDFSTKDTKNWLKSELKNNQLLSFVEKADNARMGNASEDVEMNKEGGIIGGVLLLIIFAYVISIYAVHSIEEESTMIGTMYALGLSKRELIVHYMSLPLLITFLGGLVGTAIGFTPVGIGVQAASTFESYSLPVMDTVYPLYLIIYGLFVPAIIFIIVNFGCMNKMLAREPLSLLRNERKQRKVSKINLHKLSFNRCFQIRQFLREKRSAFAMFGGIFFAVLMLMMALDVQVCLSNMQEQNEKDVKFDEMYLLKAQLDKIPEQAQVGYMKSLYCETPEGENMKVSILGLDDSNSYFPNIKKADRKQIVISSSVAIKYKLKVGDEYTLRDESEDKDYTFTVADIKQYSVGLYVFMKIDDMRKLFGVSNEQYNVLFASQKLNLNSEYIYSTTSKDDIREFSTTFIASMQPMVVALYGVSILVFIIVMYLMMKVIIDRSDFSITLFRIFGYGDREIQKLFLNGNLITVIISGVISIPVCKYLMDAMWPEIVSYVPVGFDISFQAYHYILVAALILLSYFVINFILNQKLKKVEDYGVVFLKGRE